MFATMLRIHLWYSVKYLANVQRVSCEYTAEYFVDIPSRCIGSMQLNVRHSVAIECLTGVKHEGGSGVVFLIVFAIFVIVERLN